MKATGIVRRIDDLGRIVLPSELRRILQLGEKAEVEIYTENDTVVLKKYQPTCIFCGSTQGLTEYRDRNICATCRAEISQEQ